jgi:LPS export ABC transporter protein LptC
MNRTSIHYLVVISLFTLVYSCQGSDLAQMESVTQESVPDEVSKDVILTYSDSGIVKRILKAPLIHKYTNDTMYTEFPEGVDAQFYNKQGKLVTNLTCGYAFTQGNNEELVFRDNVRITNQKNETLLSNEIYLKDSTIKSDSTVYIVTPGIALRGTSLTAPSDFSSYKLYNPVGVAKTEAIKSQSKKK